MILLLLFVTTSEKVLNYVLSCFFVLVFVLVYVMNLFFVGVGVVDGAGVAV